MPKIDFQKKKCYQYITSLPAYLLRFVGSYFQYLLHATMVSYQRNIVYITHNFRCFVRKHLCTLFTDCCMETSAKESNLHTE